ncbi:MAG TPA: alpha/beta fold hydrolase [Ktedonobacterales bacterium]|jgi:pimeloyl-ACP methyl ester carboxylesterase
MRDEDIISAVQPAGAPTRRTPTRRWLLAQSAFLVLTLALFALATWQVHATERQVVREEITISDAGGNISALRFTPRDEHLNIVAVVAHGYSGSKEVMTTFCIELAKQGITAYCFDFPGHGSSPETFNTDAALSGAQSQLTNTVGAVVDYALQNMPRRDAKLVLIGHSMGTAAVGLYALRHPELANLAATVLVSPVLDEAPTTNNPRNLLVLAGDADPAGIIRIAKMRVAEGCGQPSDGALSADLTCGDPRLGTGRKLVILPGLNHITILTASATHRQILDWLSAGLDAGITTDTVTADQRFLWLLLGLGAAFLALLPALALASAGLRQLPTRRAESAAGNAYLRSLTALSVMIAALVMGMIALHFFVDSPFGFLLQALSPDLATFLFGAGIVALGLALAVPACRSEADWPRGLSIATQAALAVGAFVFLYFTLGALSTFAWASLALTPARMWRALALALLFIPLFLGSELLLRPVARAKPWLAAGTKLTVALLTTVALFAAILIDANRLSFLLFLLPIMAIFLLLFVALETWTRREVERPLVFIALTEALILGWAVAATFPLLG